MTRVALRKRGRKPPAAQEQHVRHPPRRIGASAEPHEEDPVTRLIVVDDELVTVGDVLRDP
jgi:hypothetical protein